MILQNDHNSNGRYIRQFWKNTNNLEDALDWFEDPKQQHNKLKGAVSMYIRTGHNGVMWDYQLVAQRESKDYDEKAINNGFVALQFMSGLLDQKCFASYANKALTPKD